MNRRTGNKLTKEGIVSVSFGMAFRYSQFSRPVLLAVVAILLSMSDMPTANARACGSASYAGERTKLDRVLVARSYPKGERTFLLGGTDRRVRDLKQSNLNERGRKCGIEAARAHVLGCVAVQLTSPSSPDRKTGKAMWGKSNVVAREAAFIGAFHACRSAAMEALFGIDN